MTVASTMNKQGIVGVAALHDKRTAIQQRAAIHSSGLVAALKGAGTPIFLTNA